jgi:hypothetical protein
LLIFFHHPDHRWKIQQGATVDALKKTEEPNGCSDIHHEIESGRVI